MSVILNFAMFRKIVETLIAMRLLYVMQLSDIVKIVANEWIKTTEICNNIELGECIFIIPMPNNFHGIVVIDKIPETHSNASLRFFQNITNSKIAMHTLGDFTIICKNTVLMIWFLNVIF